MSCETETVRHKNRNRKGSPGVTDSAQGGDPAAVGMQRGGWAQDTAQDAADRTCGGLDWGEGPVRERWESRLILFLLE